jgi:hypothetical protein
LRVVAVVRIRRRRLEEGLLRGREGVDRSERRTVFSRASIRIHELLPLIDAQAGGVDSQTLSVVAITPRCVVAESDGSALTLPGHRENAPL